MRSPLQRISHAEVGEAVTVVTLADVRLGQASLTATVPPPDFLSSSDHDLSTRVTCQCVRGWASAARFLKRLHQLKSRDTHLRAIEDIRVKGGRGERTREEGVED